MSAYITLVDSVAMLRLATRAPLHSLGPPEIEALDKALALVSESDSAVLILTADQGFCAGLDLAVLLKLSVTEEANSVRSLLIDAGAVIRKVLELPLPTIAAIDGPVAGMGLALALACDIRFLGPAAHLMPSPDPFGIDSSFGASLIAARINTTGLAKLVISPAAAPLELANVGLGEYAKDSAIASAIKAARTFAARPRGTRRAFNAGNRRLALDALVQHLADPSNDLDFLMSAEFRSRAEVAIALMEDAGVPTVFGAVDGLYPPAQEERS